MPASVALILSNTSPIKPITGVSEANLGDFCACDFRCEFEEIVFADDLGTGLTNDTTDFLFRKISLSDNIDIKLFRYGKLVATIIDSSYGEYFNGFDEQPLYVGWLADWTAIFNSFSGGQYQVKVTSMILGQTFEFVSRKFRLNTFDALLADRTVKIESFQRGKIENSEFDFTNLYPGGWPSSIRLRGIFGQMKPTIERDQYLDSSYRVIQNRDSVINEYSLICEKVPETIFTRISCKDMLGNDVLISSFNLFDDDGFDLEEEKKYERFPVVPESYDDQTYQYYGNLNFSITFRDRQQNKIKRNF